MDSRGRDPGAATFRWQGKTQPEEYSLADIGVSLAMDPDRIRPHGWCAMAMPASCSESAGEAPHPPAGGVNGEGRPLRGGPMRR